MRITGIYAALCTLLVLFLAFRVSVGRRASKTGIGDGGHADLMLRIRAHANALENIPLALILLLILELDQTQPLLLHVFGIALVAGRLLHAFGLSRSANVSAGRALGTLLTWGMMAVMSMLLLWQWVVLSTTVIH